MNSEEFLEEIKKQQMSKELDIIAEMQIENLRKIKEITRNALENLGSIYDEIKTKEVRNFLEKEMNGLGQLVMEIESQLDLIDTIVKEKRW